MPTFLKKCPKCGKRFEVEHTGETVETKEELVPEEKVVVPDSVFAGATTASAMNSLDVPPTIMVDTMLEEHDYTETYECKHCGNVWIEKHRTVEDLGDIRGSGVDVE